jgi:hypothetical protein
VNSEFLFHVHVDWSSHKVYVPKAFYWGEICKKYRVQNSTMFNYDIDFHDGDHAEGYRSKYFHRLEEVMELIDQGWYEEDSKHSPPKEYLENTITTKTSSLPPKKRAPRTTASDDDANKIQPPVNKRHKATNGIPREIEMPESPSVESSLPETPTPTRGQSLSPTELFKRRCQKCPMCERADCNKCATCVLNASRTRRNKEVCLRKVRNIITVGVHA